MIHENLSPFNYLQLLVCSLKFGMSEQEEQGDADVVPRWNLAMQNPDDTDRDRDYRTYLALSNHAIYLCSVFYDYEHNSGAIGKSKQVPLLKNWLVRVRKSRFQPKSKSFMVLYKHRSRGK